MGACTALCCASFKPSKNIDPSLVAEMHHLFGALAGYEGLSELVVKMRHINPKMLVFFMLRYVYVFFTPIPPLFNLINPRKTLLREKRGSLQLAKDFDAILSVMDNNSDCDHWD